MSNEEFTVTVRKFLKQLGVTGHQVIEDELIKAVKDGKIKSGSKISVSAEIKINDLNVTHKIDGSLITPE
jgi:hypothetical protein|tara:strand:+ start:248 stop:457 length:210 start_codon:yes stop_codon:yes gene_type:complete